MPYTQSLRELNQQQLEAVTSQSNCLVIACPGSGKTKMLATKAAMLLHDPENRVAAVTFSKESAIELQHRIKTMCDPASAKRLYVGTFHSMAYKQLPNRLDIPSEGQRKIYIRNALASAGIKMKFKDAALLIDALKAKGCHIDEETPDGALLAHYQKQLASNKQMDFSDMISMAVEGMKSGSVEAYPITHLLVDEFQDTDAVQFAWMLQHEKKGAIITAVGDDDQSIFGFRSAMGFKGMQAFREQCQASEIVLGKNYRCHSEILTAADNLIRNNKSRIPKELIASKGGGGSINTKLFSHPTEEAEFIVREISDAGSCSKAILARNNINCDEIEPLLKSASIEYYRPSSKSVFSHSEVAVCLSLIELVAKIKSDVGIDAIFSFIDIVQSDRDILHSMQIADFKKVKKADLIAAGVSAGGAELYNTFATNFHQWRAVHDSGFLCMLINNVFDWLKLNIPESLAYAIIVVTAVQNVMLNLNGTVSERVRFLRENKNNKAGEGAVILTTLHGSKGLEWDRVWIARAETSICPSDKSPLEEERRLFYVGATRAKNGLTITMTTKNPTSPFVHELLL